MEKTETVYYLRKQNGNTHLFFETYEDLHKHAQAGDMMVCTQETHEVSEKLKSHRIGVPEKSAYISERIDQILSYSHDDYPVYF